MSLRDSIPTHSPGMRITAAGRQYLRLVGREQQHPAGVLGAVPTPGAPLDSYQCAECPDIGQVADAGFAVDFSGPATHDLADSRREYSCQEHLGDLVAYAVAVNSGAITPVVVVPIQAVSR